MVKGSMGAFPGYGRGGGLSWRGHTPAKVLAGGVALIVVFSVLLAPASEGLLLRQCVA